MITAAAASANFLQCIEAETAPPACGCCCCCCCCCASAMSVSALITSCGRMRGTRVCSSEAAASCHSTAIAPAAESDASCADRGGFDRGAFLMQAAMSFSREAGEARMPAGPERTLGTSSSSCLPLALTSAASEAKGRGGERREGRVCQEESG